MKWKPILGGLAALAIAGGMIGYWRYSAAYPSTDDAYVEGNIVTIASQTSGRVETVAVHENQHIAAGDLLFTIDDTLYRNALTEAQTSVASARAMDTAYGAQIMAAQGSVDSAKAALDAAQAQLGRVQTLFKDGHLAQSALDDQQTATATARAALDSARANLAQARTEQVANTDSLHAATAALATAQTNLDRTRTIAPVSGWIANISLRRGTVVTADAPLFSLVEDSAPWMSANFKETDLERIRIGQSAEITIDMLPGATLSGRVESIAYGSGATFSLLPAENASGNWVKVTQRFPVRIVLDDPTALGADQILRAGASGSVKIDTVRAPVEMVEMPAVAETPAQSQVQTQSRAQAPAQAQAQAQAQAIATAKCPHKADTDTGAEK